VDKLFLCYSGKSKTTSLLMKTEVTNVIMIFLASENWTKIYMAKAEISMFAL